MTVNVYSLEDCLLACSAQYGRANNESETCRAVQFGADIEYWRKSRYIGNCLLKRYDGYHFLRGDQGNRMISAVLGTVTDLVSGNSVAPGNFSFLSQSSGFNESSPDSRDSGTSEGPHNPEQTPKDTGMIAGAVVGSVIGLLLISFAMWRFLRAQRGKQLAAKTSGNKNDGSPCQDRRSTHTECSTMHREPSGIKSHEDYTVAVVCAMNFEMSAVRYMLDSEHPRLPAKQGDPNMYTLGNICGHNVILACLPGQQGKGAAAVVAANLSRTFPAVNWWFLVGIAGGVPSNKHDIRLGDVVVSMPEGPHGGVVQYDLGRDTDEGFRLKGPLCAPPSHLRSAVERMRSDHLLNDNKIDEFVRLMLEKGSGLSTYRRPSAKSDVLFPDDYTHHSDSASCAECDQSRAVDRPQRQRSKIHYGLIASGDSVLKSAAKRREAVSRLGDVLCFEMEAAGPMSEFPCIVIRGISDYADSHKNDDWHYFAAAAAAACAKELLAYLDSGVVSAMSTARGALLER
jgi:nucleoside phosphorylase